MPNLAQAQITMQANFNTPPYGVYFWTVYGQPDNSAVQSGQLGNLDLSTVKCNSIVYTGFQANPLTLAVGGDLNGSLPSPSVSGLQGQPVSTTAPTLNQFLVWNGSAWVPSSPVTYLANFSFKVVSGAITIDSVGFNKPASGSVTLTGTYAFTMPLVCNTTVASFNASSSANGYYLASGYISSAPSTNLTVRLFNPTNGNLTNPASGTANTDRIIVVCY